MYLPLMSRPRLELDGVGRTHLVPIPGRFSAFALAPMLTPEPLSVKLRDAGPTKEPGSDYGFLVHIASTR